MYYYSDIISATLGCAFFISASIFSRVLKRIYNKNKKYGEVSSVKILSYNIDGSHLLFGWLPFFYLFISRAYIIYNVWTAKMHLFLKKTSKCFAGSRKKRTFAPANEVKPPLQWGGRPLMRSLREHVL